MTSLPIASAMDARWSFRILTPIRRRHEGANRREAKNPACRGRSGRRQKGEMAVARGIQRMASLKDGGGVSARSAPPASSPSPARPPSSNALLRSRTAAGGRGRAAAKPPRRPPPSPPSAPQTRFAWRGTIFLCVWLKGEKARKPWTRQRDAASASINYSHRHESRRLPEPRRWCIPNPAGQFTVSLSSIDLGQGMKSVTAANLPASFSWRAGYERSRSTKAADSR